MVNVTEQQEKHNIILLLQRCNAYAPF